MLWQTILVIWNLSIRFEVNANFLLKLFSHIYVRHMHTNFVTPCP